MTVHRAGVRGGVAGRRGGFTLVELLVVVTVILILIGLIVGVGAKVLGNQKGTATKGVLGSLDRALEEYMAERGTIPPYDASLYEGTPGASVVTSSGGISHPAEGVETGPEDYNGVDHVRRPCTSIFLRQSEGFGTVDSIIGGIDPDFIYQANLKFEQESGPDYYEQVPVLADSWAEADWSYVSPDGTPRFDLDGNGQPDWDMAGPNGQQLIYYVHPSNRLAQDLFGRCKSDRPYFMSAGPDKFYGLGAGVEAQRKSPSESDDAYRERIHKSLADNLYSYAPDEARLDEEFFDDTRDVAR